MIQAPKVPKDAPSLGPSNDKLPRGEWAENRAAQAIGRKNAKFFAASPEEKRVILAKDVLEWQAARKLFAAGVLNGFGSTDWSHYLSVYSDADKAQQGASSSKFDELRLKDEEVIDKDHVNGNVCSACAIGSLVAVAAERGACSLTSNYRHDRIIGADGNGSRSVRAALAPYFEDRQLSLIEMAFERNLIDSRAGNKDFSEEAKAARGFGYRYSDRNECLAAIMQNIIDNKGTFTP